MTEAGGEKKAPSTGSELGGNQADGEGKPRAATSIIQLLDRFFRLRYVMPFRHVVTPMFARCMEDASYLSRLIFLSIVDFSDTNTA